ncbi:MAG: two-component sensor histidine kinase [Chitinophagaceae bacterium]|nr:two-component sensor histidine kinase [Chitinophagaceae bacterium]
MYFLQTRQNTPLLHKLFWVMLGAYIANAAIILSGYFMLGDQLLGVISIASVLLLLITGYMALKKGYKPAMYFLVAWSVLLVSVVIFILKDYNLVPYNSTTRHSMQIGSALEALLLSLALANRINVLKKEKEEAHLETLRSLEENKRLITEQNVNLERKVEERTQELKQANKELLTVIQTLRETQAQLIQREKMASLGELTAGIAHEIQNPLNFVNNFAEVSSELIDEINEAIQNSERGEVSSVASSLKENLGKISYHGRRASDIVKGMLQHSRSSTGQKEPTDINALTEEYLRLSYHGFRAKDKTFNATMETYFDEQIEKLNVIPQDLGRVFLNLFTNAFYSVLEKKKKLGDAHLPDGQGYEPKVTVSTAARDGVIEVRIKDNGTGVPRKVVDKIYQPFFTTKPSGEGTGLGLSISYDIIKALGGELEVQTQEGEFAEFIVRLPISQN